MQGDDDLNIVAKRIIVYCGYDFNTPVEQMWSLCLLFDDVKNRNYYGSSTVRKKFANENVWFLATFLCAIDKYG